MIAIFPEIAGAVAMKDFEMLAVLVRKYFGREQKFVPNICMETLTHNVGIVRSHESSSYIAALAAKDEKGRFDVVAVGGQQLGHTAQRFLLAHQLGHYFLHIQPHIARGEWRASGFTETISPEERYSKELRESGADPDLAEMENDADSFASCLLMPLGMARKAHTSFSEVSKFAEFFGVSEQVAHRRIETIEGTLREPQNFIDAESKMEPGEHSRKPRKVEADNLTAAIKTDFASDVSEESSQKLGMERIRELARKIDPKMG